MSAEANTVHRVAALQMVSGADVAENLRVAESLIAEAAAQGAELAVLPETFAVFASAQQLEVGRAERFGCGPLQQFLATMAVRYQLLLVGGTIPVLPDTDTGTDARQVLASCFVFDAQGQQLAVYNKIHLFDVDVGDAQKRYRESDTFVAGEQLVVVDSTVARLGLSVCYDLRFPELYRAMFQRDAQLITVPAAFTRITGDAHWLPLLRARAIENQCYVIGANQGGRHSDKRETSGGSAIINPWGEVLASCELGVSCVVADIDLAEIKRLKKNMPIQAHQRSLVSEDFSLK